MYWPTSFFWGAGGLRLFLLCLFRAWDTGNHSYAILECSLSWIYWFTIFLLLCLFIIAFICLVSNGSKFSIDRRKLRIATHTATQLGPNHVCVIQCITQTWYLFLGQKKMSGRCALLRISYIFKTIFHFWTYQRKKICFLAP